MAEQEKAETWERVREYTALVLSIAGIVLALLSYLGSSRASHTATEVEVSRLLDRAKDQLEGSDVEERFQDVGRLIRDAKTLLPDWPRVYFVEAAYWEAAGQTSRQLRAARSAVDKAPKDGRAHALLGKALLLRKDLDAAAAAYRQAIHLDPSLAWTPGDAGFSLLLQDDLDHAIAALRKAVEIDPDDARHHTALGLALLDQCDWDGATAAFRQALRIEPDDPEHHTHLGLALMQHKGRHLSSTNARRALRGWALQPCSAEVGVPPHAAGRLPNLGPAVLPRFPGAALLQPIRTRNQEMRWQGAVSAYRRALELDPAYEPARRSLLEAMARKPCPKTGARETEPARDPREIATFRYLAQRSFDAGDYTSAIEHYRKALRLDPFDQEARTELVVALILEGDTEGALVASCSLWDTLLSADALRSVSLDGRSTPWLRRRLGFRPPDLSPPPPDTRDTVSIFDLLPEEPEESGEGDETEGPGRR